METTHEFLRAILAEQVFLSHYAGVSFSESDGMTRGEATAVRTIFIEMMKKQQKEAAIPERSPGWHPRGTHGVARIK